MLSTLPTSQHNMYYQTRTNLSKPVRGVKGLLSFPSTGWLIQVAMNEPMLKALG